MTTVTCPTCRTPLAVPEQHLGKRAKCPKCGESFPTAAPVYAPAAAADPDPDENPFAVPEPEDDAPPTPRPKAKPTKATGGSKNGLVIAFAVGGVVFGLVVLGGGVLAALYFFKGPQAAKAEATSKDAPKPKDKGSAAKAPEPLTTPDGKMLDATRERVKASTGMVVVFHKDGSQGSGTGFVARAPGLVVTNAHVIGEDIGKPPGSPVVGVQVLLTTAQGDRKACTAKILTFDRELDLALLSVDARESPPPLEVIDSFALRETQDVYIFGFPGGLGLGTNISVNTSTISSLRRDEVIPWIQVAGGMNPGNSGGPVTDARGRVVGVARATIRGTQSINVAIPGDLVHSFFTNAADVIPGAKK